MKTSDLAGPLLASVSRSFYLTICVLPAAIRGPIGLAYLLARASDTIADCTEASPSLRLIHLKNFGTMVERLDLSQMALLQSEIAPSDPGERELMKQLPRCLAWLERMPPFDRAEIVAVMEKIITGQTLDLERFCRTQEIIALSTAAELEEYTYLVAGCVGEFWTRVCRHHLPHYSTMAAAELCRIGKDFGKGLQLVNILRDLPADLRSGRCYLPADELAAIGLEPAALLTHPEQAEPVIEAWLARASFLLQQGHRYIASLRPRRLRVGCFLPWYLGHKTLTLLHEQPPLKAAGKVKVSRSTVRKVLILAVPVALSNRMLNRLAPEGARGRAAVDVSCAG